MKKSLVFGALALAVLVCFTACAKQEQVPMRTGEGDGYATILWDGRTYLPFCAVSGSECGDQIGYMEGNEDDKIYAWKDHPEEEWIISSFDGGSLLFRESGVTDIPEGVVSEYDWNP